MRQVTNKLYFTYINNIFFFFFGSSNPFNKFTPNIYKIFNFLKLNKKEINILENVNTYLNYDSIIKNKNFDFLIKFINNDSELLNRQFELYELNNVLKSTASDKDMGPDKIYNIFLKKLLQNW